MAILTGKARKALPASEFAGPDRSYPVPDASHAANAKARASQAVKAGRMAPSTKAKIDSKANAVLGKGSGIINAKPAAKKSRAKTAKKR